MKILIGYFFKLPALVVHMLPLKVRMSIGAFIGILWFDVFRIRRKVAIENVNRAFPAASEARKTEIARGSLISMGRTLIEYCSFPFLTRKAVDRLTDFHGLDLLESALAKGQGVIMLTLHLGNGDYGITALSRRGYRMNLISKEFKTRWLNDLWFGMRAKHGTKFISPEKSSFEILRALKRNEGVAFVLDQFMGPPIGVRTKFFGQETGTAMGCALMAGRTGAPVLPCYTYRLPSGRHVVCFEEAIPYLDIGPREQNIAAMTQVYTDKIEDIVRKHPEQWMWIHRRWKEFRD